MKKNYNEYLVNREKYKEQFQKLLAHKFAIKSQ